MNDKKGAIVIKCWMPKEAEAAAATPVSASESDSGCVSTPVLPKKELNEIFGWPEKAAGPEDTDKKGEKKLAKYTGEKITLDFYKTELHNVFRLFAEMSGKNIIIDDQVKGELTLSLKEVPWDEAMDLVLDLKELDKEEKLGTTIIKPKQEKVDTGKGELVVKKFSEEILQPARILRKEKENRQKAQNIILEAHNFEAVGKKKQALERYEKAYSLWKDNFDLIMKTAAMHYEQAHYARSYYFAGQALRLNPKNSEAALYAAISAASMGQEANARQLFELAITSKPQIPEAFFNYALFLRKQKDFDKAMTMYQRYEQLFGPSLEVRIKMAGLCEMQGKDDEAYKRYCEIQKSGFPMDKKTEGVIQKKVLTLCRQGEE
jgi:type IV pilus assembly protein PilQ